MNPMKLQTKFPDRISALPEPIIHRILSLLPTISVKQASSLSKTWYDFCSSFPYLDFEDFRFIYRRIDGSSAYTSKDKEEENLSRERYLNYVDDTVRRFHRQNPKILIRRIKLPATLIHPGLVSILNDLIELALEHGVEALDLEIQGGIFYKLPQAVFSTESIRVVKLHWCSLLESFRHGDNSGSSSKLQTLDLTGVDIDELVLSFVISSCPLIEVLKIKDCKGITDLRISRLYKLKTLVVLNYWRGNIRMVEVDAPMLHFLYVRHTRHPPCKIGILECPRLAELSLDYIEVGNFQLAEILSRLPFLCRLRLSNLLLLTKFKISSSSLNELAVIKCKHLVEVEVDAPNLLSFKFNGHSAPLMSPMHTIMGQSRVTLAYIDQEPSLFNSFVVKFRNFISRLDRVKLISIDLRECGMISIEELDEGVVQPFTDVEELEIYVGTSENYHDIFDGLLWSCHPRTLTMQLKAKSSENAGFMKFLRDIMVGVGPCCSSIHARSWLRYLEVIMYEDLDDDVSFGLPVDGTFPPSTLEKYSWESGEIKFVFKW